MHYLLCRAPHFVYLLTGFFLLSGCGGVRVISVPEAGGAPASVQSSSVDPFSGSSDEVPTSSFGGGVAKGDTQVAPAEKLQFEEFPEDELEGPVDVAIDGPYDAKVQYRFDGDDPVPAGLSFDLGPVEEGNHELVVEVILPGGEVEKYKFKWLQSRKYDPDAVTSNDVDRWKKQKEKKDKKRKDRKKKREEKRAEKAEKKEKKRSEREGKKDSDSKEDKKESDSKDKVHSDSKDKDREHEHKRD
jgi:hypothetical protein